MTVLRNIYTKAFLLAFVLTFSISNANGQTLTDYAKKHKAELAEKQKVEKEAYDAACTKGTMDALKAFVSNYPKSKYASDANSKIRSLELKIEKDAYNSACKTGTIDAFKGFLKTYPQSQYAQEMQNRIKDFDLWSAAKQNNTVQAYNNYLQTSNLKIFASEARAAIEGINAVSEWQKVKFSNNLSEIQAYMRKYPNASTLPDAKKKEHELKGVQYYNNGNLASAYREFINAGGKYALAYDNRSAFDKCQEYHDYTLLSSFSKEVDLNAFLTKYPNSTYNNQVSNWIAIAKAKEFSMFSGDYSYKSALGYAKDNATRNQVKEFYEAKRKEYSQYKKSQRQAKRRSNGGWVNIGFEFLDFGLNMAFSDRYNNVMYYNVGLGLRIGNYRDAIQFEIGVKPGVLMYAEKDYYDDDDYDSYYDYLEEYTYKFHMPVYAKLKINLFNIASNSKLHINGQFLYNVVRDEDIENEYSFTAGLGMAWRHWDWTILYYKQDINRKYSTFNFYDDKILGCSLSYYF